jgi:hypothetical protein
MHTHKITVGFTNGTEETYYVSDFEYGDTGLILQNPWWRDRRLADTGAIPATAILAVWVTKLGEA